MTGKLYYITTLGGWRRHVGKFVHSHWIALEAKRALDEASKIFVVVEGDEGAHSALEADPEFEALPHPLSDKPISELGRDALNGFALGPGAGTFEVAEALARVHPMLRHRVF